jgi:hypothetical protein
MKSLYNSLITTLEQVKELVESCSDNAYTSLSFKATSSIGQHVRHILDHFIAFEFGVKQNVINYNIRSRGSFIETDTDLALEKVEYFIQWLSQTKLSNKTIQVISEISANSEDSIQVESNIEREAIYLINHTIHHLAYASLLAREHNIPLNKNIGIAPATASYLRACKN